MSNPPAPYQRAHLNVKRLRGEASQHICRCGNPALDWAYQFTAGDAELRSPDGSRPYSTNPDDYEAMCRECHIRFDMENDPVMAEKRQKGITNGRAKALEKIAELRRTDPEFVARNHEILRRANREFVERRRTDPHLAEKMRRVTEAVNSVKVQCITCDIISTRGAMGMHLKASGHLGRREIGN